MSSNPLKPSFRYPSALPAGVAHDSVVKAIQNNTNGLVDVNQAIVAIQSKIDSLNTVTNTVTTSSGGRAVPVPSPFPFPGLGADNNQTGNTAYTVVSTDNGILLILNDASPVAVTLDSTLVRPYLLFITNFGAGAVTLTPSSGLVNGAASLVMKQHETLMAVFDGTNWLTSDLLVLAQTFTSVAHEWLKTYDAATGLFTATQPDYSDLTGTPQLPITKTPVAGEYLTGYDSVTGLFSQSSTPGISVTITTAALTSLGTQGSMTFVDGIFNRSETPAESKRDFMGSIASGIYNLFRR